MKHWALIMYSICIQAAIGIALFAGINNFWQHKAMNENIIIIAGVLAIIGNVASLFHLGRPLRAMGALMNIRTSWLSREIWLTGIFTGMIVMAAFLSIFHITNEAIIAYLVIFAAIIGLLDVGAMAFIYISSSVNVWQHKAIAVEFYMAAISMGAALFNFIGGVESTNQHNVFAFIVMLAAVIQATAMMFYYLDLGKHNGSENRFSNEVMRRNILALGGKWVCIFVGASLLFVSGSSGLGAMMVLVGQIIGRYLFYAIEVDPQIS